MTLADQVALAVHNYLALFLLWLLIFVIKQAYCVDRFRQDMFALRDELFDYAASGAVRFDHPAYGMLRTSMNGMIRFAHRLTISHSLAAVLLFRLSGQRALAQEHHERLNEALSSIEDQDVSKTLRSFHEQMLLLLAKHMVKRSLVVLFLLSFFIFSAMLTGATLKLWNWISKRMPGIKYLEVEADVEGGQLRPKGAFQFS